MSESRQESAAGSCQCSGPHDRNHFHGHEVNARDIVAVRLCRYRIPTGAAALNAQVNTDYDHSANFSSYKTYSWLKVQSGDSLWDDRIQQDVDTQLAAKGWTKVASGGDAAASAFRSTQEQQSLETFYNGFGGGGWGRRGGFGGMGFGMSTTTPR